jgi:hypothetical protein
MAYNSGYNFGYDQYFVEDTHTNNIFDMNNQYKIRPINSMQDAIRKRMNSINVDNNNKPDFLHSKYCRCKQCLEKNNGYEKDDLREKLLELQKKNDMLTIFLIGLVIFIFMQYNSFNQGMYYANTMTFARLGQDQQPPTAKT